MSSMTIEQKNTSRTSLASTLHVWQTAANVVATDPIAARKQAYEQAIDLVSAQLSAYASVQELVDQFWQAELQAVATVASLHTPGKILNHQVVAAAACWRSVSEQLAVAILAADHLSDELSADR